MNKPRLFFLVGLSGSGKSTFLKVLSGEVETTTGEVIISKPTFFPLF